MVFLNINNTRNSILYINIYKLPITNFLNFSVYYLDFKYMQLLCLLINNHILALSILYLLAS